MSDDLQQKLIEQLRQMQGGTGRGGRAGGPPPADLAERLRRMMGGGAPPPPPPRPHGDDDDSPGDQGPDPSHPGSYREDEDPDAPMPLPPALCDPAADILPTGEGVTIAGDPGALRQVPRVVFDFRHGALPKGIEVVGEYTLEKMEDGATALNLDPVSFLKCHTPLFQQKDKKISSYTLTMDIKAPFLPLTGVPLYQTSFPEPRATSEAILSGEGSVGCFSKFGERGLFKQGKWNRIVICVSNSSQMTTYINGKKCVTISDEMQSYSHGGRDRFSLLPAGLHCLVPETPRAIDGGLYVRMITVEATARSEGEVKRANNVDTIFNQYERDIKAAGREAAKQLSLSPIYEDKAHPMWMDPAFLSEFLDSMIEGSGLEGAASYFSLVVFQFALKGMVIDQASWLKDQVSPAHQVALKVIAEGHDLSIQMYRRYRLAEKGPAQLVAFIQFLTSSLDSMKNGQFVYIPGGFRNKNPQKPSEEMTYHVQRVTDDHWRFSVISLQENGLAYHPTQAQDAPKIKYKTVCVIDSIKKQAIMDATWWTILIAHAAIPHEQNTAKTLYGTVLPWLTKGTWETNASAATANPCLPWRTIPRTASAQYRQFLDGFMYMMFAQGFSQTEAKCVMLNLRRQFMKHVVNDLNVVKSLTTSDVKILRMASQQLAHCAMKFHKRVSAPNDYLMSLLSDVRALEDKIGSIPLRDGGNLAPPIIDLDPTGDRHTQFSTHPLMERLLRKDDVDGLAGEKIPIPDFVSIDMTLIPLKVTSFEDALTALRYTDRLCTLMSVQSHIVKNTNFLKVALLEFVFTQLIPVPAGPGAGRACIWMDTPLRYGVQLDIVILLNRLIEHFVSSAFSLQTTRSFDAVRIVTTGSMAVIADAVLRKKSTDHPSEFCDLLVDQGFGFGMGMFAEQSETIEAVSPELNVARTSIMDYFRRLDIKTSHTIFSWEKGMKFQKYFEGAMPMFASLCKTLAFPIDEKAVLLYLIDSHDLVIKNYPEFQCYRDIVFFWKYLMSTDMDKFPPPQPYTQRDVEIKWNLNMRGRTIIAEICKIPLGAEPGDMETEGHRFPSGALASWYVRPNKAYSEDDILHIHNFTCFEKVLDQKDIELLISFLTVPYMRIPLVLGFMATGDRIHALREKALRNLVDATIFEPSRYLELNCAQAPQMVPSEDKRLIATPYGLLLNELHRSPRNLCASVLSLIKQARMLDTGTVYSSTVKVILYVVRLCARVENAMYFFVSHTKKNHPCIETPLRDFDISKEVLSDVISGREALRTELCGDHTACPHGSIHVMIENWLFECWGKMSAFDQKKSSATSAAEDSETEDDEADSDEDEVDTQDKDKGKKKKSTGGSGKFDRHTRLSCRLYAHLILLYRNQTLAEYDVTVASTLMSGFIFMQTRHTWNQGLLPDVPETELYQVMQVQRRNLMKFLSTTTSDKLSEVMESVIRVTTAMGVRKKFAESVVRRWGMLSGSRNICRFTISTAGMGVRRLQSLEDLRAALRTTQCAVVDVFASWCGPCKNIAPFVRQLAQQHRAVAFFKINIDEASDVAREFGVSSIPTFLFFKDGQKVHELRGADPGALQRAVEHLASQSTEVAPTSGSMRAGADLLDTVDPDDTRNEEVNLHTFQMTLLANHLKSLDENVQGNPDVQAVFQTKYPMQCAIQETAKNRDCMRLVGRLHDIHYWKTPDQTTALQVNDREYSPDSLHPNERFILELFEPVRLKFFNDPMNPIQFVLPERPIDNESWVAYLTAIHPSRGGTWKEVFVFKNWSCVHIYDVISYGRRQYRSLCYTTDARHCLRELQPPTGARRTPWPRWGRYEAGDPTADLDPGISAVIFREHNTQGNHSDSREQYIPQRLLYGLLPCALLDTHSFWQDDKDNLRGYPLDTESNHYLVIQLSDHEGSPVKFYGVPFLPAHCTAKVKRIAETGEMTLLNLQYALPGTALYSLAETLARIENMSNILAWTKSYEQMTIDQVQLPRLKLTFVAKILDGISRLYSLDHSDLFVSNDHTPLALHLIRGMPHSLLLSNTNRDLTVLVPCVRTVRPYIQTAPFSTELVMDRSSPEGSAWRSHLETPYYLYSVHVSMSFLQAPTLASALYLLLQRFQFRDYVAVIHLVDSIATDTDFSSNREELQTFQHLASLGADAHPDAHAVRAKISIVMQDSPVVTPWDLPEEMAKYITKLAHVSATCQLSIFEQIQCLEECENIDKKTETILSVMKEIKPEKLREILKYELDETAAMEAQFQDKKDADGFFKTIFDKVFSTCRLRIQKPEALRIIIRILKGITLSEYFKCLLFNRRKFVESFTKGGTMAQVRVPKFGEEEKWLTRFKPTAIAAKPNHWQSLSILDTAPKAITGPVILETLIKLWDGMGTMQGTGSGISFLFLYNLFTGEVKYQLNKSQSGYTFACFAANYFADSQQDSLMSSIISILVHNPHLHRGLPKFKDTRTNKTDEITCETDEDGHPSPLHKLFSELIPYLAAHIGSFTNYGLTPALPLQGSLPTVPVPKANPLQYITSTNIPYANLKLPTDTQGYVPTLSNTACPFMWLNPVTKGSLPIDEESMSMLTTTEADLAFFAGHQLQPVELEKYVVEAPNNYVCDPKLPFDVSKHPYGQSHVAKQMLDRLEKDMQSHSDRQRNQKQPKIRGITDEDVEYLSKNRTQIEPVVKLLGELEASLVHLRDKDKLYVQTAIPAVEHCANFVFMDPAMTVDDTTDRLLYELRRYCGQETNMWLEYLVGSLLSDCGSGSSAGTQSLAGGEWKKLNPTLSAPDYEAARNLTVSLLLHANRVGHANRALLETRDLINLFKRLASEPDQAMKLKAAILQKADSLALVLTAARHYVDKSGSRFSVDPRYLVFEFTWNIVLRKSQIDMVRSFIRDLSAGKNSVWQMVMGAGKTTVVSPLLCMFLADGKRMVMQVMPNALLEFSRGVLRSTFSSIVHKRIYTFHYDRSTQCDPATLRKLQTATTTGGIVVTNPTSVKSLMLKFIETLGQITDETRPRPLGLEDDARELVKTLHLFRNGSLMMDEVDLILHPLKSELNFPVGRRDLLDFAPMRWTLPVHLLDAMFFATTGKMSVPFQESTEATRILNAIATAVRTGVEKKALQLIPHLILLDAEYYHQHLKPILSEWCSLYLEHHNFSGLEKKDIITFILFGSHKDPRIKSIVQSSDMPERSKQMLNLSHDWLTSYMPHILQKIDRVTFGLMTPEDKRRALALSPNMPRSRFMLAIPFVGKDVPSDSSEFAHPDIIIGLTILGYRFEGMRYSDFKEVITALRANAEKEPGEWKDRKSNQRYEQWVKEAGGEIRGRPEYRSLTMQFNATFTESSGPKQVSSLRLLKQSSREHMRKLFQLFRSLPQFVHYYLNEFIFPTYMRHQQLKLSASGQELGGDALFPKRVGFSGTPSDLLPVELGQCNYEVGTDGYLIDTLTSPHYASTTDVPQNWSPELLLKMIAQQSTWHALIDTGALVTGMTNKEVATYLLNNGLAGIDGVVFLDEKDRKMILVRATMRVLKLEECGIPLERRFAFYDQIHTTGMDIKHTPNAKAVVTLGKDMTFRDFSQGAFRMRGITRGQTITIFVIPEVRELIGRELRRASYVISQEPDLTERLRAITAWLIINSMGSERLQFNQLCLQNVSNVYRKKAFNNILQGHERFKIASDVLSDHCLGPSLGVFSEPVEFVVETGVKEPRKFSETIDLMVKDKCEVFQLSGDPVIKDIRAKVADLVDEQLDHHLNTEIQQEAFQEEEKEKEQVQERELEICQFKDLQYSRDNEEPVPWPVKVLSNANPTGVFYPAAQFKLFEQQPIHFPLNMKVSNNYFQPNWSGARRVKNIIVTMEWIPSRSALSQLMVPMTAPPEDILPVLHRSLQLYSAANTGGKVEEKQLRKLLCAAFDQPPPESVLKALCRGQDGVNMEPGGAVEKVICDATLRREDQGRNAVALSLIEAETLRRIMHVTAGRDLIDGKDTSIALRLNIADNAIIDESFKFAGLHGDHYAPLYQVGFVYNAFRFMDCEMYFKDSQLNSLLRAIQRSTTTERRLFFDQIIGCKRRMQKEWDSKPVAKAFTLNNEFILLHQRVQGMRMKDLIVSRAFEIWDVFQKFDYARIGALTPGSVLACMQWLGLTPTHDDVIDFVGTADVSGNYRVRYDAWIDMLADPEAVVKNLERQASSTYSDTDDTAPPSPTRAVPKREEEITRVPPVDEDILTGLVAKRKAEQVGVRALQERAVADRELQRIKNQRQHQIQKRISLGLPPNPVISNYDIVYNFTDGVLPDDVTAAGYTEYVKGVEVENYLRVAPTSIVNLPVGCYDEPWCNLKGGILNEFTLVLHVRVNTPSKIKSDQTLPEGLLDNIDRMDIQELMVLPPEILEQLDDEVLERIPVEVLNNKIPDRHRRRKASSKGDADRTSAVPLVMLARTRGDARVIAVRTDGAVVCEGLKDAPVTNMKINVVWEYADPHTGEFVAYGDEQQRKIERDYQKDKTGKSEFRVGDMKFYMDFKTMSQVNPHTSGRRQGRRTEQAPGAHLKFGDWAIVSIVVNCSDHTLVTFVNGDISSSYQDPAIVPNAGFSIQASGGFALFADSVRQAMTGGEIAYVRLVQKARSETDVINEQLDHCEHYKWSCPQCTSINKAGTSICWCCSHVRRAESLPPWQCGICTFMNDGVNSVCSMCNIPRPDM